MPRIRIIGRYEFKTGSKPKLLWTFYMGDGHGEETMKVVTCIREQTYVPVATTHIERPQ